jgi:NADH-quinone oxidoreductase subunit G
MPKFTIDGKEIKFKQGQTIIEAAKDNGIEIPHFCWHPSLSISGNCRMCLVEVEKMPKLVIACSTIAAEGMIVHTDSAKTLSARNAVMEFLLINHPLDCPICDEAGECKLQDYANQHSAGESRFVEEKIHKDKRIPLGPYVMFDAERCISCSRCIRFCDEITKTSELTFVNRGDRVTIVTFPGKKLDNLYSLNVTDICPVGALTNRDFRFKARVWDMSSTKTICTGCARGCNIDMWVRSNEILRLTPRYNKEVNSYWMCDYGRVDTFKFVNEESRISSPQIRKEGVLTKVGWDEAFAKSVSELKSFNKDEIAVIGSALATCEDNFVLSKFARISLKTKIINYPKHIVLGSKDDLLILEDKTPNSIGAELMGINPKDGISFEQIMKSIEEGKIKALYVIEEDLVGLNPDYEKILSKLDLLIMHSSNFNKTTELANIIFSSSTYAEKNGTWINSNGRLQRIRPAITTLEMDRSIDGMSLSRLDKFGTEFDRWGNVKRIDARPTWKILSGLSKAFGGKLNYNMAEDVFNEIAKSIPAFKNLDYDVIGENGIQLKLDHHLEKVL